MQGAEKYLYIHNQITLLEKELFDTKQYYTSEKDEKLRERILDFHYKKTFQHYTLYLELLKLLNDERGICFPDEEIKTLKDKISALAEELGDMNDNLL